MLSQKQAVCKEWIWPWDKINSSTTCHQSHYRPHNHALTSINHGYCHKAARHHCWVCVTALSVEELKLSMQWYYDQMMMVAFWKRIAESSLMPTSLFSVSLVGIEVNNGVTVIGKLRGNSVFPWKLDLRCRKKMKLLRIPMFVGFSPLG